MTLSNTLHLQDRNAGWNIKKLFYKLHQEKHYYNTKNFFANYSRHLKNYLQLLLLRVFKDDIFEMPYRLTLFDESFPDGPTDSGLSFDSD